MELDVVGRRWGPGGSQAARGKIGLLFSRCRKRESMTPPVGTRSILDWRAGEGWRRLARAVDELSTGCDHGAQPPVVRKRP